MANHNRQLMNEKPVSSSGKLNGHYKLVHLKTGHYLPLLNNIITKLNKETKYLYTKFITKLSGCHQPRLQPQI